MLAFPLRSVAGASYQQRLCILFLIDAVIVLWVRLVICNQQPGRLRLAVSVPVLAVTALLPCLFSRDVEIVTLVSVTFQRVWLTNFKVLGLALDRGPLTLPLSLPQFATVLLAPFTPQLDSRVHRVGSQGRLADSGGSAPQLLLRFVAKTAGLCVVVYGLTAFRTPVIFREILQALGLLFFLGFMMDGLAVLVTSLTGLKIAPHFNNPYFSTSIASFWSSRWNLTAANTLRFLIYDPLCDGRWIADRSNRLPVRAPQELRALAMMASFVTSGIIHEVMYYYSQGYVTGQWLVFFAIQGPMILVEMACQRLARKQGWLVPRWMKVAITLTALMAAGHCFFFPPAIQGGLADRVIESIKDNFASAYASVQRLKR